MAMPEVHYMTGHDLLPGGGVGGYVEPRTRPPRYSGYRMRAHASSVIPQPYPPIARQRMGRR